MEILQRMLRMLQMLNLKKLSKRVRIYTKKTAAFWLRFFSVKQIN